MKADLFKEMMAGFNEAIKYRTGHKARVRVSRFSLAGQAVLNPRKIREVRTTLGLSQAEFARYLGTSVGERQKKKKKKLGTRPA